MKKEVASFPRRIFAYIIDLFILNTLILRPFKPFINFTNNFFSFSMVTKELIIVSFSLGILSLLYWTLLELTVRQSIGKMIARIYVSSKFKQFDLKQAFLRNISKITSLLLFFDVLYALINKTHQRYMERVSNTEVLVIRRKK